MPLVLERAWVRERLGMTTVEHASTGPTRPYHLAAKLLLAGASVVVALLVIEVGLRTQAWIADDSRLEVALARDEPPLARGQHATLRQLVRTSRNDRIVYELRPDLDVVFLGERVVTSPDGPRRRPSPADGSAPTGGLRLEGPLTRRS